MDSNAKPEHIETIVIGAGQAGLSVGYHLKRMGLPFLILDGNARIGDSWRQRWDSLRLFTPARFDGLDGMKAPGRRKEFITKDQMADYLETYAARFALPVRTGVRVDRVTRAGDRFLISAGDQQFEADQVVVAMADYQQPKIPAFAAELDPGIVQLHSRDYRNPGQLQPGRVLLVGAGNSGAEIGIDVARTHQTWIAGRDTGHIPFRMDSTLSHLLFAPLTLRVLFHRVLTLSTPMGRKASRDMSGGPLIRQRPQELMAAGIERVPRVAGVRNGQPLLDDGRVLEVDNVVWCTGFHAGFSWIDLPGMDGKAGAEPAHKRGIVPSEPGLYFVGLHFLYAFSSTMIHGVGRDAKHVAKAVEARARAARKAGGRMPAHLEAGLEPGNSRGSRADIVGG